MNLSFQAGAMGGMRQASYERGIYQVQDLVKQGSIWAINGIVFDTKNPEPMFTFKRSSSELLVFRNDTAWPHPIHLHGHYDKGRLMVSPSLGVFN